MAADLLKALIGKPDESHVGYVYAIGFEEVLVLCNDDWKSRANGIPQNAFLVAAAFNPEHTEATPRNEHEVILLRVISPVPLPTDEDLGRTRIEGIQRFTQHQLVDPLDGFDPLTHSMLQYGGLKCRIIGTFTMGGDHLRLGSDIDDFRSACHHRVYKPMGHALELIVNHVDRQRQEAAMETAKRMGFKGLPEPFRIASVRLTSTQRQGGTESPVPVTIQPFDLLAKRTAAFGMTRTGKSNTIKTIIAAIRLAAESEGMPIGQIVFDIRGEYANSNHQDDGSSIAELFSNDTIRYRADGAAGFEDMRTNFFTNPGEGQSVLAQLAASDVNRSGSTDMDIFLSDCLNEPDRMDRAAHERWRRRVALYQCILVAAGFVPPRGLTIRFAAAARIRDQISAHCRQPLPDPAKGLSPQQATQWLLYARAANLDLEKRAREPGYTGDPYLRRGSSCAPWLDPTSRAYANVLARLNDRNGSINGWRSLTNYKDYHSPARDGDLVEEIYNHLLRGRIVILDLSTGLHQLLHQMRITLAKRIARQIYERSMEIMRTGQTPPQILVYVEEAHNLIGKKDDLRDVWPTIAQEGGKANLGFVYATQLPSNIHEAILGATENLFVTHLNSATEINVVAKYYDFADFARSIRTAQDVGFCRMKTLSSPFVIPVQIDRFSPAKLKVPLAAIQAKQSGGENRNM